MIFVWSQEIILFSRLSTCFGELVHSDLLISHTLRQKRKKWLLKFKESTCFLEIENGCVNAFPVLVEVVQEVARSHLKQARRHQTVRL